MKAIVLAGGNIEQDSLLSGKIQAEKKSLALIHGKPMVQWVVDALCDAKSVDQLLIMGLSEEDGISSSKPVIFMADSGSLINNMRLGASEVARISGQDEMIFVVSGDIPGLQGKMADWLADQIEDDRYDIYYGTAPKHVIEKTFPGSNRSFINFKDVSICGGDINMFNTRLFHYESDLWEKLTNSRKSPLKQAAMIGIFTMILIAAKQLTLEAAAKRVCRKLKIRGKALVVPYAEMAMDVDKPHQFDLMEKYLSERDA